MTWLVLVDKPADLPNAETPHKVMTVHDYLLRPKLFGETKPTIINLARSYAYQGGGYYCSLLAEARGHRVIPSVETMIELSRKPLYAISLPDLEDSLNKAIRAMKAPPQGEFRLTFFFGRCPDERFEAFGRLLFDWYRTPLLKVKITGDGWRSIARIRTPSVADLSDEERGFLFHALDLYTRRAWRAPRSRTTFRYSMAVLYDPNAVLPPSAPPTLKHMAKVAARLGVAVEPIEKSDLDRLTEFDALFIRETTAIDNHTYRFARRATQEGMPVIDDPVSMIRCTNKVYLAELLAANDIAIPKTVIIDSLKQCETLPDELGWPIVLKIPDGSFSRGVFKLDEPAALSAKLSELLDESDLVLAQEFVPTSFDWRIGVLGGEPLFACQYMMAKKHWQIIHHQPGKPAEEGRFRAFTIAEAPPAVIETAVKAARLIGDGLYGVDLKETENGVLVIEINDNPNLEHGIEDSVEKDAVWEKLVGWFVDRLDRRR
ncbi:RimK family protein [Segnochrobactrum spirostomi]|uniref:RimK family protein n=1 Tax=Segnochrobactrum spirostomi TaxID=2608987 RepID=A0A6A7YAK6_9HYPH|nr:RimK family protein [Segnochrobactrum spirostomi]MQT14459.1 RimK family protein [Segnochrobactrum spirostomi]